MIDPTLLRNAKMSIRKVAFSPLTPEAQQAVSGQGAQMPPPDPVQQAGGAMPPMDPAAMDPSMMGGGAGMPPMDPSMMGGGAGMPPMDPSMMGGGAGMPPMDPNAMPPMDPSMMGGAGAPPPPGGPVISLEDAKALLAEEGGKSENSGRVTTKQVMEEVKLLRQTLESLIGALGIQLPAADVGAGGEQTMPAPEGNPEDLAAAAGIPKQAADKFYENAFKPMALHKRLASTLRR